MSARRRFESLRVTQGAMIVFGIEVGLSLVFLLMDKPARHDLADAVVASPSQIFEHGRVWTLATTVFLQDKFITLLLHGFVMFMFVPTLERFWGTKRFYTFFGVTSVVGVAAGCAMGLLTGNDAPINGLDPFIYASIVAFGITYARQPVQFFGVLPLTGRQLMFGFIGFLLLFVLLQKFWEVGAAYGAAMITAAVMTSKRWSPGLAWRRWQIRRARAKLSVIDGGTKPVAKAKKRSDGQKWLN